VCLVGLMQYMISIRPCFFFLYFFSTFSLVGALGFVFGACVRRATQAVNNNDHRCGFSIFVFKCPLFFVYFYMYYFFFLFIVWPAAAGLDAVFFFKKKKQPESHATPGPASLLDFFSRKNATRRPLTFSTSRAHDQGNTCRCVWYQP
jgi:hypothetical protein